MAFLDSYEDDDQSIDHVFDNIPFEKDGDYDQKSNDLEIGEEGYISVEGGNNQIENEGVENFFES